MAGKDKALWILAVVLVVVMVAIVRLTELHELIVLAGGTVILIIYGRWYTWK